MTQLSIANIKNAFRTIAADLDATQGDDEARLAYVDKQEQTLHVATFGVDDAWELGEALYRAARELELPVALDIRLGLQRAFHAVTPGAKRDNDDWADRKGNVVLSYNRSSLYVGTAFRRDGDDFDVASRRCRAEYAAFGGAFPITLTTGLVVGVVEVSGLADHHDHALATAALAEFLNRR